MPKYYVTCLELRHVVQAKNEIHACVKTSKALNTMTAGVCWVVSERGFEKHDDDVFIPDDYIIREFRREQE